MPCAGILPARGSCAGFTDRINELPVLMARVKSAFPPYGICGGIRCVWHGPGQTLLSIMSLAGIAGSLLCNAPACNPNCGHTSRAPAGSPQGAGMQGFASCQRCIWAPPICAVTKNQSPSPSLPSGGTAAQPTLTLRF